MSIKIMSAIFENEELGPTHRLIMLSLADHADDWGRCYPSISRLCQRTGLKERAVQINIRQLEDAGYITIHKNAGPSGANVYMVRATPASDAPPAQNAPRIKCAPPPHIMRETPASDAPKPSGTINEPSEVPPLGSPEKEKRPAKARLPEDWALSDEGWAYARSQQIPDMVIEDEARGFHAYWADRTDADARKSQRGWEQCWAGWCRRIASRYRQAPGVSRQPYAAGNRGGSSLASIAARRRAEGGV